MARAASGARPCGRIRAAANPGDRPHQNRSLSSPFQNSPEKATPTPTGRTQVPITWALGWLRRRLTTNRDRLNTGLKCFQHKPPVSVQLVRPQESGAREEMARHLLKAIERIKRRAGRQIGNGEQSRAASEDGLCEALLRSPTPEPVTPALLHEKHGPDAACDPEGLEECVGGKGGVGGGGVQACSSTGCCTSPHPISPLGCFSSLLNVKATKPVRVVSAQRTGLTNGSSLKKRGC